MSHIHGPRGPIPVERDAWGYPRVHARSREEGVFALGHLHGTDRLFQTQLSLLIAQGRLMEIVGDKPFARRVDRAVRGLSLHRGAAGVVAELPEDLRAEFEMYCRGMRAGSAVRGRPLAMRLLGLPIQDWTPAAAVLVYRLLAWFGMTSTTQLARHCVGELMRGGADLSALRLLLGPGAEGLELEAAAALAWREEEHLIGVPGLGGSNAFAIAGSRTASGGAIVLSEFHMEVGSLPPVVYAVDLRYDDGSYVIGITAPGVPHFLTGRNREVAWTYTFGHGDHIDLTVETTSRGRVQRDGVWSDVRIRKEVASIRGAPDERWTFFDLDDGTTLLADPIRETSVPGLRWRGVGEDAADHAVLRGAATSSTVEQLVSAHRRCRMLSTGAVFGDRRGHIAWMHTGRVAKERSGWGPSVHPGGPDVDEELRPVSVDPVGGAVAAANEEVAGWTAFAEPSYRRRRLDQLLAEGGDWTSETAAGVTRDRHDLCAERLLPVWAPHLPDIPEVRAMVAWGGRGTVPDDHFYTASRRFHALHHALCREVVAARFGRPVARRLVDELGQVASFQEGLDAALALERPELLAVEELAGLLDCAWRRSEGAEGPALGPVTFHDPLTEGKLPSFLGLSVGPVRLPGTPTTLFQARRVAVEGHSLVGGPAFHLIMDMGLEGGHYDIAGGASERRFGPGYGAGVHAWAEGEMRAIGPVEPDRDQTLRARSRSESTSA